MSWRQRPELVGESQVVADEQAQPHPTHLDGDELGTGTHVPLLAGVGEGVDLAIPVHGAIGTGEHEHVGRSRIVGRRVRSDLGARPADPRARPLRGRREEVRRRPALLLADARRVEREAGRERLGQQDQTGATSGGRVDHRAEPGEVRIAVVPHDVVLDRGHPQHGHANAFDRRRAASSITGNCLQQAKRTMWRPNSGRA